jgi:predicted molibdopterin-dependent oxidoreductase YjgC
MANEDLFLLRRLVDHLGIRHVDFRVPPRAPGHEDQFLIKADKNPNSKGAELIGLLPRAGGLDAYGMIEAARDRRLKCLWVFHHDLTRAAWREEEVLEGLLALDCLVFEGSNQNGVSPHAHLMLPSATYAEREGTFTNFEGRVQRFSKAVEPLGESLADWEILARVGEAVGLELRPTRAEDVLRALAQTVPAFSGMSYRSLADRGQKVSA